jgi:GDP-L-fucose synthase
MHETLLRPSSVNTTNGANENTGATPNAMVALASGKTRFSLKGKRVWVAGHRGMVGSAIVRRLQQEDCEVITIARQSLDLTRQSETEAWLSKARPQVIFVAAARVGGIHANSTYPVDFLYENIMIEANIIHAAHKAGVEKLMLLGSSCIYPRDASQPMSEPALLGGYLEPSNEWYAIAKIAGVKLCQAYRRQHDADFISVMPTNIYGPGDNFNAENSHVPAALLWRFHVAKLAKQPEVTVWGSGSPLRDFMYVDDVADACVFVMQNYSGESHLNVGTGEENSIADFARRIRDVVGYHGRITFDTSRSDGTPRKALDVSSLTRLGWSSSTSLEAGLNQYYEWFLSTVAFGIRNGE